MVALGVRSSPDYASEAFLAHAGSIAAQDHTQSNWASYSFARTGGLAVPGGSSCK